MAWLNEVEEDEWKEPSDIKRRYSTVSFLSDNLLIFNLKGNAYRLAVKVDNKLTNDGKLGVELKFNSMADFEPDQIVQQVEPLRRLVQGRQRLSDLLSKMDGNDKLESLLTDVLQNTSAQQQLGSQLGLDAAKGEGDTTKKEESK